MPGGRRAGSPRRSPSGPSRRGLLLHLDAVCRCAATSHEVAAAFGGDDIAVRARGDLVDTARPAEAVRFLASLGTGVERLRVLARMPRVPGLVAAGARADCEVGAELTTLLGLPSAVTASVLCAFERYDGKGAPVGRSGDELPEPARYAAVGHAAVMFDAVGGPGLAVDSSPVVRSCLDPRITGGFLDASRELLELSEPETCGRQSLPQSRIRLGSSGTTTTWTRCSRGSATRPTSRPRSSRATRAVWRCWRGRRPMRSRASSRGWCTAPGSSMTSAGWPSPRVSGSSPGRCDQRNGSWCVSSLPLGADPVAVAGAGAARTDREPTP